MSNLLIIHNNGLLHPFKEDVLNQFTDWHIHFLPGSKLSVKTLAGNIREKEIHFLLYADELEQSNIDILASVHTIFPLVTIIYYFSQMKDEEFACLYRAGINFCIVGDARQINLIKTLHQLWDEHWRRIPDSLLPAERALLPERAKKILDEIETKPLKTVTTSQFAKVLNISESRFRAEFKKTFGLSFRDFKQKLLRHYETLLLLKKGLKPSQVFDILNYKNISAFSRSFKSRHGSTWQQLIRQSSNQKNIEGLL